MIEFDIGFEIDVLAFAVAFLVLLPSGGAAQDLTALLGQDTARVGDVVPVALPVEVGAGERVVWPDTLPMGGADAENAIRVRERVDTLDDGRVLRTGVYGVTPWRPGPVELPAVRLRVLGGGEGGEGGERTVRVGIPPLQVASVLPADTTGIEPRPARGVMGANWAWGRIGLIALLVLAVVGALAWWLWRRRGGREEAAEPVPLVPPRERALAALQEARDAGLLERGEMKEFYTRVSEAVRLYAGALYPGWSADLTTTEILGRFRSVAGVDEARRLREILVPADQVKFARRVPDRDEALEEWAAARAWVSSFRWPPARTVTEEEAA